MDGVSVGAVTTYKFANVIADHTISASFSLGTGALAVTDNPDAAYLARTTKIDFSALPDWSEVASVDDGVLGVTLSRHMIKLTAGSTAGPAWGGPG